MACIECASSSAFVKTLVLSILVLMVKNDEFPGETADVFARNAHFRPEHVEDTVGPFFIEFRLCMHVSFNNTTASTWTLATARTTWEYVES